MSTTTSPTRPTAAIVALALPIGLGSLACAAIVGITRSVATIPSDFGPFEPSSYIGLTAFGILAGLIGWLVVRRRAANPAGVLRVLVPAVVVLSLVPDVLLGVTESQPGTTWAGVIGLMAMHLAVAAVAVGSFARFLPLPRGRVS